MDKNITNTTKLTTVLPVMELCANMNDSSKLFNICMDKIHIFSIDKSQELDSIARLCNALNKYPYLEVMEVSGLQKLLSFDIDIWQYTSDTYDDSLNIITSYLALCAEYDREMQPWIEILIGYSSYKKASGSIDDVQVIWQHIQKHHIREKVVSCCHDDYNVLCYWANFLSELWSMEKPGLEMDIICGCMRELILVMDQHLQHWPETWKEYDTDTFQYQRVCLHDLIESLDVLNDIPFPLRDSPSGFM
ncbi:hypothetical protein PLICRDRAFT_47283 [Plicaturopsis crispa FD-325 SS-3]|uniref:Uncharacterized protein n=1 Tax=Plicaturopsis crispa FD-325 SS-3 TaxID=944288 RepID=A0A0C9SW07_PLICR|nr:hypothetical protein PLICRDRAFT_47283 [Plicaturopsis crispa FD-325 SS-3]